MIKQFFKKQIKHNKIFIGLVINIIWLYIIFCKITSKITVNVPTGYKPKDYFSALNANYSKGVFAIFWHQYTPLALTSISGFSDKWKSLSSPHSDGKFMAGIIQKFGYDVIAGSSNKDALSAIKNMITDINKGTNIVITPDGPRGPAKQINSNIVKIATRYDIKIVAITCKIDKYFKLRSWDEMIIPKPFANISVNITSPLDYRDVDNTHANNNLHELLSS